MTVKNRSLFWVAGALLILLVVAGALSGDSTRALFPSNASSPGEDLARPGSPLSAQSQSALMVVSHSGHRLRLHRVDLLNGQDLPGFPPLYFGANFFARFSQDGRQLAAVLYPRPDDPSNAQLRIVDLAAWKTASIPLDLDNWASALQWSPDGQWLALATAEPHSDLYLFDLSTRQLTASLELERPVVAMQFTGNSRLLMLYQARVTYPGPQPEYPIVTLLSTSGLSTAWRAELPGLRHGPYLLPGKEGGDLHAPGNAEWISPGVAFSPVQDALYLVLADQERLLRVDFAARSVRELVIRPELSWFESLIWRSARPASAKMLQGVTKQALYYPHGERLYVLSAADDAAQQANGEWQFTHRPLGLQALDPRSGVVLDSLDTTASSMSLAPDGASLVLHTYAYGAEAGKTSAQIVSLPDFSTLAELADQDAYPALSLEGGAFIFVIQNEQSGQPRLSVLDGDGFETLAAWQDGFWRDWVIPR